MKVKQFFIARERKIISYSKKIGFGGYLIYSRFEKSPLL
jgi:hypothetical protein